MDRGRFFEQAAAHTELVSVSAAGTLFLVRTTDHGVGRSLFAKRKRAEMQLVRHALKIAGVDTPGVLVDIGANIGTASLAALNEGLFDRAVAVEPEPDNVWLLRMNAMANGVEDRYTVIHAAAAERDGEVSLLVSSERSGKHEVQVEDGGRRHDADKWSTAIPVPAVTLDTLATNGVLDPDRVALVWMDTQGHEGHVLKGAGALTSRGVPVALELAPKLLSSHGGLGWLVETVERDYTHFVPLHKQGREAPAGEFARFVDRVESGRFTDVLLLRR